MKVKLNLRDILADHRRGSLPVTATVHLEHLFEDDRPEYDLDEILEANRMIAHVWAIADVRVVRPDLTDDKAWEVLKACERHLDSKRCISPQTIETAADEMFGQPVNRVARFDDAIQEYTDYDARTNLVDLLADGLHWCEAKSVDFAQALLAARKHFAAETEKGGRP